MRISFYVNLIKQSMSIDIGTVVKLKQQTMTLDGNTATMGFQIMSYMTMSGAKTNASRQCHDFLDAITDPVMI